MKTFLLTVVFFIFYQTNAQVNFAVDTNRAEAFLTEVQLNCPEYVSPLFINRAKEKLSRVLIHHVPQDQYPECKLLSNIPLKDKCNPGLQYDIEHFDPQNFNPLKYQMSFKASTSVYYRVDGKDYIIEIKPFK
jgi:hypothetical protein